MEGDGIKTANLLTATSNIINDGRTVTPTSRLSTDCGILLENVCDILENGLYSFQEFSARCSNEMDRLRLWMDCFEVQSGSLEVLSHSTSKLVHSHLRSIIDLLDKYSSQLKKAVEPLGEALTIQHDHFVSHTCHTMSSLL